MNARRHRRIKRLLYTALALLLAVNIGLVSPSRMFAEAADAGNRQYIEGLRLFIAETVDEALADCRRAGCVPVNADLNADNGEDAVVLGYVVTDQPNNAITDITVLEMNNGYNMVDYSTIAEEWMEKLSVVTSPFMVSVDEYKRNLADGSPEAEMAREMLNVFYVPKGNAGKDIGLGEYLAGDACNESFIKRMICLGNTGVTYVLFNAIAAGVADHGGANWAQRVSETSSGDLLGDPEYTGMLDRTYYQDAADCQQAFIDFAKNFTAAKQYVDTFGMDALVAASTGSEMSDMTGFEDVPQEAMDKITGEAAYESTDNYLLSLYTYEFLNQYDYDPSEKLGDAIVRIGSQDFNTPDDVRELYPVMEALTRGQKGVLRVVGIPVLTAALFNSSDVLVTARDIISDAVRQIREFTGGAETISVFEGADLDLYGAKVALTSTADRTQHAGDEYGRLTETSDLDDIMKKVCSVVNVAGLVSGVACGLTQLAAVGLSIYLTGSFTAGLSVGMTMPLLSMCWGAVAGAGATALSAILGLLGCFAIVASYAVLAVFLIYLIVEGVEWLVDQIASEKDALDYDVDDIPLYVYDYYMDTYRKYSVVRDQNGNAGDLNAGEGRRFAAMYTTKNRHAGDPIEVTQLGEMFAVSSSPSNRAGYEPVSYFGQGTAANLNAYSDEADAKSIYLFFCREPVVPMIDDAPPLPPSDDTGETPPAVTPSVTPAVTPDDAAEPAVPEAEDSDTGSTDSGKLGETGDEKYERQSFATYLQDIEVACAHTQAEAKDKLLKEGFQLIDKNLTPNLAGKNGWYTYLGYKTTYQPAGAITDIRVSPRCGAGEIHYGGAVYTLAGDTAPSGWGIFYATNEKTGTPIYAQDLLVTDTKPDLSLGFEPVNMFCGGGAYDLNDSAEEPYSVLYYPDWHRDPVYIYFHPTETFTGGEEYLGGLTFFYGSTKTTKSNDALLDYMNELGYTRIGGDFSHGAQYTVFSFGGPEIRSNGVPRNASVYLGYSTTHNPYRAIYDVKSFTTGGGAASLNPFIGSKTFGGYAVSETLYQISFQQYGSGEEPGYFGRGVSLTHSYTRAYDMVGHDILIDRTEEQPAGHFENASWNTTERKRFKSLFVEGPFGDKKPLRVSDIEVIADGSKLASCVERGMYPVQDARDPNGIRLCDLSVRAGHPQYVFVRRGSAPAPKKYISSLYVSSFNIKDYVTDEVYKKMDEDDREDASVIADNAALTSVLGGCGDEIVPVNLAVEYPETWLYDDDNEPINAAYLGVTRTDDPMKAVRSIVIFRPASPSEAASEIRINNITFTRAGGKEPIHDRDGGYYIYYTTGSGCAPGEPITSVSLDRTPLVQNCATALTASAPDAQVVETVNGLSTVTTRYAELKGDPAPLYYLHARFETSKTLLSDLYVGSGATEKEAMIELLQMGCCMLLPIDMNRNSAGSYVYLGYQRYAPNSRTDNEQKAKNAIRDILCTVGQEPQNTVTVNGVEYKRTRDRYNYGRSKKELEAQPRVGAVSLNEGTNGRKIYMYYTADVPKNAASFKYEPITELAAHTRDFVPAAPSAPEDKAWESVLTASGRRCNFNEGAYNRDNEKMVDNRIYLYAHRRDNTCKPGSVFAEGCSDPTIRYGSLDFVRKAG